jgi:hypothetical protein
MTSPVTVSERDLRTDRFLFVRGVKSLGKAAASPPLFFLGAAQVTGSFLRSQGVLRIALARDGLRPPAVTDTWRGSAELLRMATPPAEPTIAYTGEAETWLPQRG